MGLFDFFGKTQGMQAMNNGNLQKLREPKSKYYRLVQAVAGVVLGLTLVVFLLSCFLPVLRDHFRVILKLSLILIALCAGAFCSLPWIYFLERSKTLQEKGKEAPAWLKWVCIGFFCAIGVIVVLWIIAVFVVHLDTFRALLDTIVNHTGFGNGEELIPIESGAKASLDFLAAAIILSIQVGVGSVITASIIRYKDKHKVIRIINYIGTAIVDLWASWIIGCIFTGNVFSLVYNEAGVAVDYTLMAPLNPKQFWLVLGILGVVATAISGTVLSSMVRRDRMRAALKGDTAALSATDEDFLQDTYEHEQKPAEGKSEAPAKPAQAAPAQEKSPAEKLKQLKELYESGIITDEEYEKKRQDIIDKM